jgi:hypothetical protein
MCSLDVRFTVESVLDTIFEFLPLKMTSKTYLSFGVFDVQIQCAANSLLLWNEDLMCTKIGGRCIFNVVHYSKNAHRKRTSINSLENIMGFD